MGPVAGMAAAARIGHAKGVLSVRWLGPRRRNSDSIVPKLVSTMPRVSRALTTRERMREWRRSRVVDTIVAVVRVSVSD